MIFYELLTCNDDHKWTAILVFIRLVFNTWHCFPCIMHVLNRWAIFQSHHPSVLSDWLEVR